MDSHAISQIVLALVFAAFALIPVSYFWFDHRTRTRGLDTLRVYAERGEEPPSSVIEAVTRVTNPWGNPTPRPPQSRANHLAHAAASTVIAVGLAALVWW